jgi:hypothetical protein
MTVVQISDHQSLRKTPLPKRQRHRDPFHWCGPGSGLLWACGMILAWVVIVVAGVGVIAGLAYGQGYRQSLEVAEVAQAVESLFSQTRCKQEEDGASHMALSSEVWRPDRSSVLIISQAMQGNCGMPSGDDYRRHASECVRLAQNAQNPADKALLLKMAETWLRLAEQTEGRESKDPD